jgi:glycyl-tRNA synthetase beta chain
LRRAALGVIRILAERRLQLSLRDYARDAALESFIYERARGYFQEQGYSANEVEAVLAQRPERLDLVPRQLEAVRAFAGLPEAESLAAANKRIGNILKQAGTVRADFDAALLVLPEEKALAGAFQRLPVKACRGLSTPARSGAAALKAPVVARFSTRSW